MGNQLYAVNILTHNFDILPDFNFYWYGERHRVWEFGIDNPVKLHMATSPNYNYCFVDSNEAWFLGCHFE